MPRSIDAFIFDMDGTLLNTLPDLMALTNETLTRLGYPTRTEHEIRCFIGNGGFSLISQAVPVGTEPQEARRAFDLWKRLYPEFGHGRTVEYPGMTKTLEALRSRGAKVGLLSNKFDDAVKALADIHFSGLFDTVHGEGPSIPRKPDPTGLLLSLRELGIPPERAVYLGDAETDVETARNAGTFAAAVSWGYADEASLKGVHPDAFVLAPEDIPSMLF